MNVKKKIYNLEIIKQFIQLCLYDCRNHCHNCNIHSKFYAVVNKLTTTTPFQTFRNVVMDSVHLCRITDQEDLIVVNINNLRDVYFTVKYFIDDNYMHVIDPLCCVDSQ